MNLIIKPEYMDTWFPVPKVLVERDMPMRSIQTQFKKGKKLGYKNDRTITKK
jgi:hypothetical protein